MQVTGFIRQWKLSGQVNCWPKKQWDNDSDCSRPSPGRRQKRTLHVCTTRVLKPRQPGTPGSN